MTGDPTPHLNRAVTALRRAVVLLWVFAALMAALAVVLWVTRW